MKYFKIDMHELAVLVALGVGLLLRLVLLAGNWPVTNADEGTIGIMALHIAYHGEHPVLFYGQNYMGVLQAYLGAALFHLLGPSLFVLRLGLLILTMLFLVCMYLLARMLYTRGLALLTVILLSVGSSYVLARQLSAIGGYPETLLLSALAFLLACWLTLHTPRRWLWRCVGYTGWGLAVGLGLWSDLLIIPFVVTSGLLLLLFCWRDLLRVVPLVCCVAGVLIGMAPLLEYNLHALPGQDSLSVLWRLEHAGGAHHYASGLFRAVQVSIPMMTGNPFCTISELPFLGATSPHTLQCALIRGTWGWSYLLLLLWASILVVWATRTAWRIARMESENDERRNNFIRQCARLLLHVAAWLTFIPYALSNAPVDWPGIHARYLIGLLIATPALLWPLWRGAHIQEARAGGVAAMRKVANIVIIVYIAGIYLAGTLMAVGEIPAAQMQDQQQQVMIQQLLKIGATHIYTDYWMCDSIAFLSQEKIICGVLDPGLQPSHNRYEPYYVIVSSDPHTAYVFRVSDSMPALQQRLLHGKYRHFVVTGYNIYQPVNK